MSFEVRPLNIVEYKGDAIVNSLGIRSNSTAYGGICKSILKATGSLKIKQEIASHEPNAEPGHIFTTEGYGLPAKHIIHICTPFFSHDPNLFALEHVYKVALITAYKKKWYKIGLPIIGTGANGYPHAYVLKMIVSLVDAFSKLHKQMRITICMPVVSADDFDAKFDQKEIDASIARFFEENKGLEMRDFYYGEFSFDRFEDFEIPDLLKYSEREIKEVGYRDVRQRGCYAPKQREFLGLIEALLDSGKRPVKFDMTKLSMSSVAFYIETYIETRFPNPSDQAEIRKHVNLILSGNNDSTSLKSKHGNEDKRTTISLPMLMRYILALHMTQEEADTFLMFCGRVFSPVSKEDAVYKALINNKKYVTEYDDIYTINSFCLKEKGVHPIFEYCVK